MNQNDAIYKFEVRMRYYESGALYSEAPYENGERHGIESRYYESGTLEWETPFVNDKVHGISRGYDEGETSITRLTLHYKSQEVASIKS